MLWGVMRHPPRHHDLHEDRAVFDGWYHRKSDAQHVYANWAMEYRDQNVVLVKQSGIRAAHKPEQRRQTSMHISQ